MSFQTQGSCDAIIKPPDPNNLITVSGSYTSDTLLNQVITERNALRIQNEQLWKIIEKQRTIIQQLQKVSSKHSALLRQRVAEKQPLKEEVTIPSKSISKRTEIDPLEAEPGLHEDFLLEPLSPTSLESHTDELLLQIELSEENSQSAYAHSMSSVPASTQYGSEERCSPIAHARTISLDTDPALNKMPDTTRLRRSLTSPLPLNITNSSLENLSPQKEISTSCLNFSRPPRANCPPSPLSLESDDSMEASVGNKIRVPISPLFPPPILNSNQSEEIIRENKDCHTNFKTNTDLPKDREEATQDSLNTTSTIRPKKSHTTNGSLRLTLDDFGPEYVRQASLSLEEEDEYKELCALQSNTGALLIKHANPTESTNEDASCIENASCTIPKVIDSSTKKIQDISVPIVSQYKPDNSHSDAVQSDKVCEANQNSLIGKKISMELTSLNNERKNRINSNAQDNLISTSLTPIKTGKSPRALASPTSINRTLPNSGHTGQLPFGNSRSSTPLGSPAKSTVISQGCKLTSLVGVDIRVTGSAIRINAHGKEVLVFLIGVGRRNGLTKFHELWTVEKYYSDFLALDAQLKRTQCRSIVLRIGKLPDRNLFFTHAPSKVDQRKLALQKYLQHLISLNFSQNADVCEFLSTNVAKKVNDNEKIMGIKEGYLTKRGKNFGGWKRRYFVLKSPTFQYYEAKDGAYLGSISIPQCQISRQPSGVGIDDTPYRHAFMIVEPKKNGSGMNRHILCAGSDAERDEWVAALNFYTHVASFNATPILSASAVSEAESDGSKSSKKGGKLRKLIRNDLPIRAKSPVPPLSPTNHGSFEVNNRGYTLSTGVGCTRTDSADQLKAIHRKSSSFKDRLLRSSTPPPPMPLLPINTESSISDSLPLSPTTAKKAFGGGLMGVKQNKEKENNSTRKKTPFGWGKKIFTGGDPKNRVPPVPVFGSPLEKAVEISKVKDGYELPAVIHRCIEYLDAKEAHKEEGIYRLSGSTSTVRALKDKFNAEGDYDILKSGLYYDIHAVSGVLKLYLRELPISILTRSLHTEFLHVTDLLNRRERVNELGRLISTLPIVNYTLLRCLIAHLIRIAQHSSLNKMTVRNIGIVFSPTLGIPAGVFNLLMTEFEYIFWINAEGCAAPKKIEDSESEENESKIPEKNKSVEDLNEVSFPRSDAKQQTASIEPANDLPIAEERTQSTKRHPQVREFLMDQAGRSNRNSVVYADSAPHEFVKMEKDLQGSHSGIECEEEELYDLVHPADASMSATSYLAASTETTDCYLTLGGETQSMEDSDGSYEQGGEGSIVESIDMYDSPSSSKDQI